MKILNSRIFQIRKQIRFINDIYFPTNFRDTENPFAIIAAKKTLPYYHLFTKIICTQY